MDQSHTCQNCFYYPFTEINTCEEAEMNRYNICGDNGTCTNEDRSYLCKCQKGFTNYGNKRTRCSGQCRLHCSSTSSDTFLIAVNARSAFTLLFMVTYLSHNTLWLMPNKTTGVVSTLLYFLYCDEASNSHWCDVSLFPELKCDGFSADSGPTQVSCTWHDVKLQGQ